MARILSYLVIGIISQGTLHPCITASVSSDTTVCLRYETEYFWGTAFTWADVIECPEQCCGGDYDRYCCSASDREKDNDSSYWSDAAITGVAIGGVVALILLVGAIVAIVHMCSKSGHDSSGVQPVHYSRPHQSVSIVAGRGPRQPFPYTGPMQVPPSYTGIGFPGGVEHPPPEFPRHPPPTYPEHLPPGYTTFPQDKY